MRTPTLYTIGFTEVSAQSFFATLRQAGVKRLIDTRLNNKSQLAGFAKKQDLEFFARELLGAPYEHQPLLAPTQELLDQYKKKKGAWDDYAQQYRALITARRIEQLYTPEQLDGACFLCSEHQPHFCHRRLAAEYLQAAGAGLQVAHLVPP